MSGTTAATNERDFGTGSPAVARRWHEEIKLAEKSREKWVKRSEEILKLYAEVEKKGRRRFNVLWSNVQTLQPAIYARIPKVVAQRRFNDADPVARAACTIIQRAAQSEIDEGDFDQVMRQCRDDYLLVGQGVAWHRYKPHFESKPAPVDPMAAALTDNEPDAEPQMVDTLVWEQVETDYIHWKDFLCSPARTWQEVRWVARRVFMTKDEGQERFKAKFDDVPLDWKPDGYNSDESSAERDEIFRRATVFEIWDRTKRKVYWIAKGAAETLLDEQDDFLNLDGFFPCARPLFATTTNDSVISIPDYALYQDQAMELDDICHRRSLVLSAIRVAGIYDGSNEELEYLLSDGGENRMIASKHYGQLAAQGGVMKAVDWLPVDMLVKVLGELNAAFAEIKAELYEITGISDILRGQTEADETATAQGIKSRFATLRLADRQAEMQRFCRDNIRIIAEIMCKNFSTNTLLQASDYAQSLQANPQAAEQAVGLLKDGAHRGFRIDVETDSTIAADETQERQDVIQFLDGFGKYFQQAVAAGGELPQALPVMAQMLLFAVRRFRIARELEQSLEDMVTKLQQPGGLPPPKQKPGGDPPELVQAKVQHAQAQTQVAAENAKAAQAKGASDVQVAQAQMMNIQSQIEERKAKLAFEAQQAEQERDHAAQENMRAWQAHQQDMELARVKALQPKGDK